MIRKVLFIVLPIFSCFILNAQISISNLATPYSQDFNTLANTGTTNSSVPAGWAFLETGSGANGLYAADIGSTNSGNTYSYGAASSTDRAFGGIQSGSLIPTIGVQFVNNSGSTITSITINYTGEQWRLGTLSRVDQMDFQYSLDASSLSTGIWTDENNLDFIAPVTTGTVGALNGNVAPNRTVINSFTITGLSIADGSGFWLRWNDLNATSADDGLAIDDFTIAYNGTVAPPCSEPVSQPSNLILTPTPTTITIDFTAAVADEYMVVRSTSSTLSASPVDGTAYAIGTAFGGGNVVNYGTSTSFVNSGLLSSTLYYYFVFAINSDACSGGPNYYNLNPLTGNSTTLALPACITPSAAPTNLLLNPGSISVSGSFTTAAGTNRYLTVRSLSSTLSVSPANGTTYSAGQSFGGGTVVSYSSGNSFNSIGLTAGTLYYFFVFSANGDCSGEPFYNTTSLSGSTTTLTGGGIPPSYYDAANALTCAPLKTALFNIISANYTALSYTPGVWDAYQTTDLHRNDLNTADIIWDMYSDNPVGAEPYTYTFDTTQCGTYNSEADCYNREHSFPKSWFADGYPMYTDLNHLFPTDGYVNGRRSNFAYGEVSAPTWTSLNGSKLGPNTYPGFSGTVFEPRNEYKGDLARGQLYMVTRYENLVAGWVGNGNAGDILSGNAYPALDAWDIKLMFKWHGLDPVSQKEINRNNAVYALQGNRNPFIDHPEYVYQVWQCTGLLPVTITDFTAQKNNEFVFLKWYATFETNFKKYEIERSTDGIGFYKIGEVAGKNLANYSFTDNNLPNSNTVYYRLKMIDIDGLFSNSKTLAVRLADHFSNALVYPNPTKEKLIVTLQQALTETSQLIIADLSGRIVNRQLVKSGLSQIDLDVQQMPAGRYFIRLYNHNTMINQSFVIIK